MAGLVAHRGEELAEDFVAERDRLGAGDRVFGGEVGDGLSEAFGHGEDGEEQRLAEQAERSVEGDERLVQRVEKKLVANLAASRGAWITPVSE